MRKPDNNLKESSLLRKNAEKLIEGRQRKTGSAQAKEMDMLKLIHELEVHQVELEMQMDELREAKEKAERAEEKYSQLYDFAPSGYVSLAKDGRIIELNFSAAKLLNKERSALINRHFALYVSEETRAIFNIFLNNIFTKEGKQSCELIIETEDNSPIYVYVDGTICPNSEVCALNIVDISERKRIEIALIQSKERYKRITTGLTDYLYSVKFKDGKAVETIHDESCLRITGFTAEEFYENPDLWYDTIFEEDRQSVVDAIAKIGTCRKSVTIEHRIVSKNSQIRWIKNVLIPKFNDANELVSYDGVIKDISEIKLAEQALQESETKFKEIINQIYDGIVVFDEQGKIVIWNKGAEQIFGFKADDALNNNVADIQYKFATPQHKDKELIKNTIKELITLEKTDIFNRLIDYETVMSTGEMQNIQCTLFPINLESSNLFCTVIRDTTEMKKFEKMLVQLNADKDRFIAILAHDIKSPFNTILGFLELLTENIRSYDINKIELFVNMINESANNTFVLLEDVLLWIKASMGNVTYNPKAISLSTIFKGAIEPMHINALAKNIKISYLANNDLVVYADEHMLQTVLRNLLANAIKFTNSGGSVNIYAEQDASNITITVADNGVGIDPDLMEKLFNMSFITTTKGTANESGTGLGLLLCKEFIEKHGGKIWAESEIGKGSHFKFTIPIQKQLLD